MEEVTRISGFIQKDGYSISGGNTVNTLMLQSVMNKRGTRAEASGKVLLISSAAPCYKKGQILTVNTRLLKEAGYLSWADSEKIEISGWVNKPLRVRSRILEKLRDRIDNPVWESSGLFQALFLGEKEGLSEEIKNLFRQAGCSHILALSGMHIGIIAGIILLLLRPLTGRKTRLFISLVCISFYVWIAGCKPSLLRAAVMIGLVSFGRLLDRRIDFFHVLLTAFLILILFVPESAEELSFQLSFFALGGILIFGSAAGKRLASFFPPSIAYALGAAFGAQIGASLIIIPAFSVIYPVGVFAGIIITPIVFVFIWGGIISLIVGSEVSSFLFLPNFLDTLAEWMKRGTALFARCPGILAEGPIPCIMFYAGSAVIFSALLRVWRWKDDSLRFHTGNSGTS